MSNIKLYIINYTVPQYNKIGIASVTAISAQKAQSILQATGKYNAYKYSMSYPVLVHTTDTFTAESIITELDNPAGEKGDRGPQGPKGDKGEKGDPGDPMTWEKMDPEDKMTFKEDAVADVESEIKTKYYPNMSVGMADNLVGRGDVQDAHINFRPSAGANTNITDGAARIERIKGNTVVYNQLVKNADFRNGTEGWATSSGSLSRVGNLYEFRSSGGSACFYSYFDYPIPNNHKVLVMVDFQRLSSDHATFGIYLRKKGQSDSDTYVSNAFSTDSRRIISTIFTTTASIERVIIYPMMNLGAGYTTVIYNVSAIDLTQMFGAGNEPTSYEEYLQCKPMNIEDEYAYNAGELVDMHADKIISTSDNAYDYTKGYARVMGGVSYTITVDNRNDITPEEVYFSETLPVTTFEENIIYPNADGTYTFPSNGYANASFMGYEVGKEDTICICLKHSYDKPHPAYQQEVKDLSFIGEAFPEGMRSAGSVCDEISFNPTTKKWKAVKRIGEVDLGSLEWTFYSNYNSFVTAQFYPLPKVGFKAVCNKYPFLGRIDNKDVDKACGYIYGTCLGVRDSSYADATTFKQAMQEQGVKLYYELAEPIVVELDYPTAETNMDYLVWDFGTEEAIASYGDDDQPITTAPFRADINYEPNAVDDLRWAVSEIRKLKAQIEEMQSAQVNETSLIE